MSKSKPLPRSATNVNRRGSGSKLAQNGGNKQRQPTRADPPVADRKRNTNWRKDK